ncbi:uncharacterized protein Ir60a [Eurosta solidaginis]|uniref:uncharacterized protein Ir60a n=1 Tax=Eurosta solidaginis TaxID=178769 RepID=UPI003530CEA2
MVLKLGIYEICVLFATHLFMALTVCHALMNDHQETANSVIFLRPDIEMSSEPWISGINCLDAFVKIIFTERERLTRSYNLLLTNSHNISSPALEIQHGFAKAMHEAISTSTERERRFFQIRTISNNSQYVKVKFGDSAVIYTDYYIIVIDSVDLLRNLMGDYISRMVSWNPGARFLVLFNNAHIRTSEEIIAMEIFTLLQKQYYVHQIGLLYATNETDYSFSVMDYYNKLSCRSIKIFHIGYCNQGEPQPNAAEVRRRLKKFERDIKVKNCTFHICAAISAPFVEKDCRTGLELRILGFMRNRLKFKIKQSCRKESRGIREENGTWTGLLGKLLDRNCDFILGGFFPDNEVIENFWTSDCYFSDSYTWFVKVADKRPVWMALTHIFKDETWLCFLLLLICTWIFWYFFVYMLPEPLDHKDFSLAGINAMAVSICVAVEERPECWASRVFFLNVALYGMNVVAIYTSQLIKVFTDPGYFYQMQTLEEVVAAAIPFGGPDEYQDWFENEEDMWIFENYNDTEPFIPNSASLRAVRNGQRVLLASRMYVLQDRLADELFPFSENVFSSSLQIIMKAGFPLKLEFNRLIRSMRDHGIFQKIDDDFRYNNTYLNRISKMRPDFKESAIVLTLDHLKGSFSILWLGVVASVISFLGELLYYWVLKPRLHKNKKFKRTVGSIKKNGIKKRKGGQYDEAKGITHNKRRTARWLLKKVHLKLKNKTNSNGEKKFKSKKGKQLVENPREVDIVRGIRFTPIKRRYIYLNAYY